VLRLGGIAAGFAAFSAWEIATPRLAVRFETPAADMWVPRLGMAALAALGIGAVVVFLARVLSQRAGWYAAAILATTPLWFVHGRTSTGVIVPMAAEAFVLSGIGIAMLAEAARASTRAAAACVAIGGAAIAWKVHALGVVVAPPMIALGVVTAMRARGRPLVLGGTLIAGGIAAAITIGAGAKHTFDSPVAAIAYALLPWTPLVPLAVAARAKSEAHRAVVLCAALAIGAHSLAGAGPLVGVAPIACAIALALRAIETEVSRPSVAMVLVVVVVGLLVARDLDVAPERVAGALAAPTLSLAAPEITTIARVARAAALLATVLGVVALVVPRTWLPTSRGIVVLFAGVLAGMVLRAYAFPSLLARLSPGEAFEAYLRVRASSEPLATVGVDTRALHGVDLVSLANADSAGRWIASREIVRAPEASPEEGARRFLALSASELPRVNAAYRGVRGANLPILAGASGSVLLAASDLAQGETSESPLDRVVMSAPPPGLRALSASLGDRLDALGWDLVDDRRKPITAAHAGRTAHLRFAVRVREGAGQLSGYCTFIHIDSAPTRFSAEHKTHTYPMTLWHGGDIVIDDFEVVLPPHFHAGRYAVYWGVGVLPCADDQRMPITSGPDDGHARVPAGFLEVK
jgi:hypothetical protein